MTCDVAGDVQWIKEQTLDVFVTTVPSATRVSCRLLELHPLAVNLKVQPVFEDDGGQQGGSDNILLAFLRAVGVTLTNLDVPFNLKALILKVGVIESQAQGRKRRERWYEFYNGPFIFFFSVHTTSPTK